MTATYPPTAEQQAAIDLFTTGRSLVIEAGAGTGKTSTLQFLANSTSRKGQYIAFNKAIVLEAATKFPGTVNCSTAHSLAYQAVATDAFQARQRQGKRMRSIDIANRLGIDAMRVPTGDGESKLLASTFLSGLVMSGIRLFCQTADPAPTARHIPRVAALDFDTNREIARRLVTPLTRAWNDLTTPDGGLPFTTATAMSVYLKLWQLSSPVIASDYILFDEAQDANPVMMDVVARQADAEFRASRGYKPAQIVWVGDSQQQIYAFTGAVNALAQMAADERTFLTQSFRFGRVPFSE